MGSYYVSGKLLTYPFPKPTFFPKWEVSVNVNLEEGRWVVSQKRKMIQKVALFGWVCMSLVWIVQDPSFCVMRKLRNLLFYLSLASLMLQLQLIFVVIVSVRSLACVQTSPSLRGNVCTQAVRSHVACQNFTLTGCHEMAFTMVQGSY